MGQRGPRPTPTAILRVRGSRLADRNDKEPHGPLGRPPCPEWIDPEAKEAWEQLAPMLEGMGVLTQVDGNALARYCQTWSRWRKCEEFLKEKGHVYPLKDETGRVKCLMPWPQVSIARGLAQQLLKLEQEFGMTPAARTRIEVQVQTYDAGFDEIAGYEPSRSAAGRGIERFRLTSDPPERDGA